MFNTLAYSKELEKAGFTREQAEVTINVFYKFMEHNFATKFELSEFRAEMRTELDKLKSGIRAELTEVRHSINSLENRMTIKLGLMQTAALGLLTVIIKLL